METPNWGIEPVPERLRVLGTTDTFLLWTRLRDLDPRARVSASSSACHLKQALLATECSAGVIGCSMLAVAEHRREERLLQ